ncbi:hypothetical protein NX059_012567 [Plenodomus lindquistii]|nr:hypothetical protein NX059_012567 [Plenodomus lindquistii]
MVKADPARNYYADLKVSANASENEIRKAFRSLALQYHPDRNPGREADFVVKFQEIQAAHEVLCDATQRAKYDAERRKYRHLNIPTNTPNTPRTRPPPPPRNAYTTTTPSGSYYRPPPPKPSAQPPRPPPPQHHSTYNTGADRFTSKNFRAPPTAQRPADTRAKDAEARANVFTAWQKMKQPRSDEPRQYNPGAHPSTPQQPQNNPNGTPFGRSQSTRVPSNRSGFDPSTPGVDEGQARSAYRNYARAAPTPPESTTPSHSTPPAKDTQHGDAPYMEANRVRTPYFSHVPGERTSMFEGVGRSASVRNSPTHSHRPSPSHDAGAFSDSGRRPQRNSYAGKTTKPFPQMYSDSSEDESESDRISSASSHRPPPQAAKPPPPPTWAQSGFNTPDYGRKVNGTAGNMPNSFKSRSEESINMKFSPSDWHGKFEGSADYFAPNMQKGASNKGRTSPSRGRPGQRNATDRPSAQNTSTGPPPRSSFSQSNPQPPSYPIPPPPPGPPPNVNFPPGATFSPQAWAQTFQDPHWVFADKKETSPRRASEAKVRPKAGRKGSVPQSASKTQAQPDASRPKYQAFAEEPTTAEPDAMDIDPPAMQKPTRRATRTAPSSPKLNTAAGNGAIPNGFATAPSSATTAKPPGQGLDGLADLANPLLAPQNGNLGLDDIKSALPFDSQPSNTHPTKPNTAQALRYPEVPVAPSPPVRIDLASAEAYFNRMETYVKAFRRYSKTLTEHFNSRNVDLEALDDHFIHHRGETTQKPGFASYLSRMKEDEAVMATWQTAQSSHIQALLECEVMRNKALKLSQNLAS